MGSNSIHQNAEVSLMDRHQLETEASRENAECNEREVYQVVQAGPEGPCLEPRL